MVAKEHRCATCGALLNVERCIATTHAAHNGRQAERERIIDAIRERGNKWASLTGREAAAAREAMYAIADELENRKLAP